MSNTTFETDRALCVQSTEERLLLPYGLKYCLCGNPVYARVSKNNSKKVVWKHTHSGTYPHKMGLKYLRRRWM